MELNFGLPQIVIFVILILFFVFMIIGQVYPQYRHTIQPSILSIPKELIHDERILEIYNREFEKRTGESQPQYRHTIGPSILSIPKKLIHDEKTLEIYNRELEKVTGERQ